MTISILDLISSPETDPDDDLYVLPHPDVFTERVENMVAYKSLPVLDSLVAVCDEMGVDVVDAKKLISKALREKLEHEARSSRMLRS